MAEGYATAWLAYILASLVLLFVAWRFLRRWLSAATLAPVTVMATVLLLLPARVQMDDSSLAPAIIVALLEFALRDEPLAGAEALNRLLIATLVTAAIIAMVVVYRRRKLGKN